ARALSPAVGTPQLGTALARCCTAALGMALLAACNSSSGQVASHSASLSRTGSTASPSPTVARASAYGVLTDWRPGSGTYNVYLVTPEGAVAAHALAIS